MDDTVMAFVRYRKGSLGDSPDAAKAELSEQSALIDSLEESSAKSVGDLKHGADHTLGQRIEESAFIRVHQRQNSCAALNQYLSEALLAADQRR